MDFADALHLGLCQGDEALMTFDKAFVKKASKSNATPAVRLA
jgi:predicted nucleic acid-binding protein